VEHGGIEEQGWLNGHALAWEEDRASAVPCSNTETGGGAQKARETREEADRNDQGGEVMVARRHGEWRPVRARLDLAAGWNRLLLKLVMRQGKGEVFAFAARLTSAEGGYSDNDSSGNDSSDGSGAATTAARKGGGGGEGTCTLVSNIRLQEMHCGQTRHGGSLWFLQTRPSTSSTPANR
jgi:hypothetical protein